VVPLAFSPSGFSPSPPSGPGDAPRSGWGVPSGAGEPTTDDLGVDSRSLRRANRLTGRSLLAVAVDEIILVVGGASLTAAETFSPAY
jgi:hypothetical protein